MILFCRFFVIEISHIGSKEQKDISNSCRKCIDLASEIAKVSFN